MQVRVEVEAGRNLPANDMVGGQQTPRIANFSCSPLSVAENLDGYISGTERATRYPLVSKQPDFRGFSDFQKKTDFFNFWISVVILTQDSREPRGTGDLYVSKQPDF